MTNDIEDIEPLSKHVLVLASPDDSQTMDMSRRLRECDVPTTLASNFEDAQQILGESLETYGAILIPTQFDSSELASPLSKLLAVAPADTPQLVSFGQTPDKRERKKLRKLGFRIALWSPLSESQVQFQINRALNA